MTFLHISSGGEKTLETFFDEVLLNGLLDTLKIIPFLFFTYILMELIEHKASDKFIGFMQRSGPFAPAVSGLLGAVPQCGFSAAVASFYTGGIVTAGTLVAVFLSTSDEMLPILISGKIGIGAILAILGYKAAVGILVGFILNIILRLMHKQKSEMRIDEICRDENCMCKNGILPSAIHHTLTIGGFLLAVTMAINALVYFIGGDAIANILYDKPIISHTISAFLGLIPNCAISVALTDLCIDGYITVGTMLSGLFSGAGVGLLVLFKTNKKLRENLIIAGVLVLSGIIFGALADLMNFSALF